MSDFHDWYFENDIDDLKPSWELVERAFRGGKENTVDITKLNNLLNGLNYGKYSNEALVITSNIENLISESKLMDDKDHVEWITKNVPIKDWLTDEITDKYSKWVYAELTERKDAQRMSHE